MFSLCFLHRPLRSCYVTAIMLWVCHTPVMMFCFLFLPVVSGLHPFFFSCIATLTACRPGSQMKSIQAVNQKKVQKLQIAKQCEKGKLSRVSTKELEKAENMLKTMFAPTRTLIHAHGTFRLSEYGIKIQHPFRQILLIGVVASIEFRRGPTSGL